MKRDMQIEVARMQTWTAEALATYLRFIDAEIKNRQFHKAAAMKAQRNQRKARLTHEQRA